MSEHKDRGYSKEDVDNRSRQLDPEHEAYWRSRGEDARPADWRSRTPSGERKQK